MRCTRLLLPFLLLAGCSAPTDSAGNYPQNPAISDAQGYPRDSTTFYFPAADSLHATYIPKNKRPEVQYSDDIRFSNCTYELEYASYALTYFDAPVLSNYYLGKDVFRFLWLRSFDLPVLLTLHHDSTGAVIRTQLLDKEPGFDKDPLIHPDSLSPKRLENEKARYRKFYLQEVNSPRHLTRVAEGKRRAVLIDTRETSVTITPNQWLHFRKLLTYIKFHSLPACEPSPGGFDGAYWLLEAHQAEGYRMVFRHSPGKQEGFRKACEYLLDLSSARSEERY